MKKSFLHTLVLLGLASSLSCQSRTHNTNEKKDTQNTKIMHRYSWSPSANGPIHYPIEVYTGYFYEDDRLALIADGSFLNNGWGTRGAEMQPSSIMPNGLKITWFSFRENKFYTGEFALPQDTIAAHFKQGFIDYNTRKWRTYDAIVANMAPGGVVVVWMLGGSQCAVEIGRYQAEPTEVNWKEFLPYGTQDREKYIKAAFSDEPEVLAHLEKNEIQYDIWDRYRIRYKFRIKVLFPKGYETTRVEPTFHNGERECLFDKELEENPFKMRSVPRYLEISWLDVNKKIFGVDMYFKYNEEELFEAFKLIYKENKQQEVELVFRYNEDRKKFSIYLRSKTEEIEIRKTHQAFDPQSVASLIEGQIIS